MVWLNGRLWERTLRRVILLLTNVMFVGHILLGCCLHHVHTEAKPHAEGGACEHHGGAVAHSHVFAFIGDHEHEHDSSPGEGGAPNSPCDEVRCSFVKCEVQRVDVSPAEACWIPLATIDVSPISRDSSAAALALGAAFRTGDCPLHQLYCALLI